MKSVNKTGLKASAVRVFNFAAAITVALEDRPAGRVAKHEGGFSFRTLDEVISRVCYETARAKTKGYYLDPLAEENDSQHHIVAAAQKAATAWFGPYADAAYQYEYTDKRGTYWLFPSIQGQTTLETAKQLAAIVRSAFIHKSMTYDLAAATVKNLRKMNPNKVHMGILVEWLRVQGLFEPVNDTTRTYLDATGVLVPAGVTAVLYQRGLALFQECKITEEVRKVSSGVPAWIEEEFAIRVSRSSKLGTSPIHTKHVKSFSVAGESAVKILNQFASVGLKMHDQFQYALSIWFAAKSAKKANESVDDHFDRVESLKKQYGRLSAEAERLGSDTFWVSKAYDYRGRMYDASGELSFQALKELRGLFGFAEAMPINEHEINVQKGRIYFDYVLRDKAKYSDEHCALHGAAWDGKDKDGNVCMAAVMLFDDPARAFCSLDANQQAFQMTGLAFGDSGLLKLTNVIGDRRLDLYGQVAKMLGLETRDHAKVWLIPYVYGAGVKALTRDYCKMFGKDSMTDEVMQVYVDRFEGAFPAAAKLKDFLSQAYKDAIDTPLTLSWTLPDGFRVEFSTHEVKNLVVSKDDNGFKIKLKSTWVRNFELMVQGLAPNLVHSLDGYMLRRVREICGFDIVPVHDSYSCHSCNVPVMRAAIVTVMQEIAEHNVLDTLVCGLVLQPEKVVETGIFAGTRPAKLVGSMGNPSTDPALVTNPYMFM